jgi:hypothetical protein
MLISDVHHVGHAKAPKSRFADISTRPPPSARRS